MSNANLTPKVIAEAILNNLGSKSNVVSVAYCITRLRMSVKDIDSVQKDAIKKTEGVMGLVVQGNNLQIVLGPGRVTKVAEEMGKLTGIKPGEVDDAEVRRQEIKQKNSTPFKLLLKKISNIFIPLIPAFIACGLVSGINNLIVKLNPGFAQSAAGGIFGVIGGAARYFSD